MRLSTRKSALALWQAETTADLLRGVDPHAEVELVGITSKGDADRVQPLSKLGRIGVFTVEVDRAVQDGRADLAVHSLKDMLTTLEPGLVLAGVLPRGPVEDALVAGEGVRLADLPEGARLATGSLRRAATARSLRPDLEVIDIRGNVETRLEKWRNGEADALILARAGLERLGLGEVISEVLDARQFVPAVGQGIVGLVCRADDEATHRRAAAISDPETFDEALAERAFLRALRGGCNVPAAGHARAVENALTLTGRVLSVDGSEVLEDTVGGPRDEAEALGERLAARLAERGADDLIAAAREL